ncbi:MAG: helix-turn-helix transcriptional regulator [Rickettsiales bacterium]|jgi:DNA-binding XRE family transcriptional regulator
MGEIRTIEEHGKKFVVIPMQDYKKLCQNAEENHDITAYDAAIALGQESFPISLYDRIDAGENAILVFRKYRELTQTALAELAGIERSMLSAIEHGKKTGSVASLQAIARVLDVSLDDLI